MLFNSIQFFMFFCGYFLIYCILPARYNLLIIIVGSTIFYSHWNIYYMLLPHLLTIIAFFGVQWMSKTITITRQQRMTIIIIILLLPLLVIKYSNFLYNDLLVHVFNVNRQELNFPLPLSISFVTFTLIAYVVDVYYQRFPTEQRLSKFLAYVLFFPHLIAGPILRPVELLPQLKRNSRSMRIIRISFIYGLIIFTIGMLKKVVFADSMSEFIDMVYANTRPLTAFDYILAIYGFSLQIYCDFSGYTDMAIGLSLLLCIRLPGNFSQPYCSTSIIEFWRRWHITLSNWLRDYVYISLGGNRCTYGKQVLNILITFGIGGLWHGANWTFILWGLLHGFAIVTLHGVRKLKSIFGCYHIPSWVAIFLTFHFVTFTWILFRSPSLGVAYRIICGPFTAPFGNILVFLYNNIFLLILLGFFFLSHSYDNHKLVKRVVGKLPVTVLWPLIIVIWLVCVGLSNVEGVNKFIYFDF